MYPAGATTNSDNGVTDIGKISGVLSTMTEVGMLLLIHGEVTDNHIDIFDREKVFIETHLTRILRENPTLKIVMEHITTKDAVDFLMSAPDNVAATITPQHLLLDRNDLLAGGLHSHNYCLPVLKRNIHKQALREAVASGTTKIFLGTDSAPHERRKKESSSGCAGCYTAWSALELYAQIFDELGILNKLEAFASFNGSDFYGLPRNTEKITLERSSWQIPKEIELPNGQPIVPFFAGKQINWRLKDSSEDSSDPEKEK